MKKILHILKTPPDEEQRILMEALSAGNQSLLYPLQNREDEDYEDLVDLIFEYDKVVVWW